MVGHPLVSRVERLAVIVVILVVVFVVIELVIVVEVFAEEFRYLPTVVGIGFEEFEEPADQRPAFGVGQLVGAEDAAQPSEGEPEERGGRILERDDFGFAQPRDEQREGRFVIALIEERFDDLGIGGGREEAFAVFAPERRVGRPARLPQPQRLGDVLGGLGPLGPVDFGQVVDRRRGERIPPLGEARHPLPELLHQAVLLGGRCRGEGCGVAVELPADVEDQLLGARVADGVAPVGEGRE